MAAGGLFVFAKVKGNQTFEFARTGLRASSDPAVIAEGEYLFHGPMHCTACHDESKEASYKRTAGEKVLPIGGVWWELGPLGRSSSAADTQRASHGVRRGMHLASA